MKLYKSVNKNFEIIKKLYGNSSDLKNRVITLNNKKIGYIFLESLSSDDKISDFLMKSITNLDTFDNLFDELKNNIYNSNLSVLTDEDDICFYLSSGFTIIFIEGYNKIISIETKAILDRGVNEPTTEAILRGPKDSFTENPQTNIGLIRKRIKDNNLWINEMKLGVRTNTKIDIIYIKDVANTEYVKKIESELKKINIDGIIDSGYIKEFLSKENKCAFPQILSTERPDLVSKSLLEGKIAILVENSPFALILPSFLIDFLHSAEDYYQNPYNITFTRIIRFLSFILTLITPAFYIAVTTWNQEVIPNELLISLSVQKAGVPFPTTLELILMITTFEILKEADIRIPNASGASVSIVGALILGEAAVSAGIVSPIIIIVVAFTSIAGLVYTDVDFINAIRWWRFIFIIFATLLGFTGLIIAFLIFLVKICSIEFLKIPYTVPSTPLFIQALKDSIIKFPRLKIKTRAPYLSNNKYKSGDNS